MRRLGVCLALGVIAGCAGQADPRGATGRSRIQIDPNTFDFAANPRVLERILQSPFGYFRFINRQFSQRVCQEFGEDLRSLPKVNLHGDAHLEQYAVTSRSRGLTDFDDSTTGPFVLDLVRFGVSIYLAAQHRDWEEQARDMYLVFLDGYRAGLTDAEFVVPEPAFAARLRSQFVEDREAFLDFASHVVVPIPDDQRDRLIQALVPTFQRMVENESNGANDAAFFEVISIGRLGLGIGSALDDKYLVRVQGRTTDPGDDVILELKEVRDLGGISCIDDATRVDPFRILLGQSRIAYAPYDFVGYVRLETKTYWIHSWVINYQELDVDQVVQQPVELAEVVFDVGVQLGRGHPNQIASPMDDELRGALLDALSDLRPHLIETVERLTEEVVESWRVFGRKVGKTPTEPPP
ncbi:MAG: DUF2252 family protein [Myxococcales bacterium]|nr:DUF2252 family protein [Myxococcales bacterium]